MSFSRFRGLAAVFLGAVCCLSPAVLRADDLESVPLNGIALDWTGGDPDASFYAELSAPSLSLRLVNHDRAGYTVLVRTLEDAGSLQTRRISPPSTITLAAGGEQVVTVRFGAGVSFDQLTHSGMVTVSIQACPSQGGPCVGGTPEPLFFHGAAGRVVVYGESVLCGRFRCGDLYGTGEVEKGTWRALGGGPLQGIVASDETAVAGGAQ
jgi:hypothetical protein